MYDVIVKSIRTCKYLLVISLLITIRNKKNILKNRKEMIMQHQNKAVVITITDELNANLDKKTLLPETSDKCRVAIIRPISQVKLARCNQTGRGANFRGHFLTPCNVDVRGIQTDGVLKLTKTRFQGLQHSCCLRLPVSYLHILRVYFCILETS